MAKGLPGAASVVFYLLDAKALLREQFFRLGFLLSNRYWKDSLRLIDASGGISSRGTLLQRRSLQAWPLSPGCAC